MSGILRFLALTILLPLVIIVRPVAAEPLPALGADLSKTTVSGLSSGAYMAGQFQIAYSVLVQGAGIIAGGPYGCARTPGTELNPIWPAVLTLNLSRAQNSCMKDGWWWFSSVPSVSSLIRQAKRLAADGDIAPLNGLSEDKVYLFSSSADDTIESGVVETAVAFYREAGVPSSQIRFDQHDKAAHAFLTETDAPECGTTGPPFLNDCDFDQAGAVLKWLLGSLQAPGTPQPQSFLRFSQSPYTSSLEASALDTEGVAYLPESCRSEPGCGVHVVFHGCKQGLEKLGEAFVRKTGYASWAETNRLILLFPQIAASALNPNGCWDWWGYTGRDFLQREAPQMLAVKRMLDALAQ